MSVASADACIGAGTMARPEERLHDLETPGWIAALYHALALPFLLLALITPVPGLLWQFARALSSPILDYLTADSARLWLLAWVVLLILICGLASFGTILLFGAHARAGQRKRNEDLSRVATGVADPFVLYLRPFREDRRTRLDNPFRGASLFMHGNRISLEMFLSLALHPARRLIAVGDKFRTLGADKLSVNDAGWFDTMKALAEKAEAIVMIPGYRGATAQEVDFLFATPTLLSKTIFVQPACGRRSRQWRDWVSYVAAAKRHGIPLSEPTTHGQLFFRAAKGGTVTIALRRLDLDAV